jgi:hypothetical protein
VKEQKCGQSSKELAGDGIEEGGRRMHTRNQRLPSGWATESPSAEVAEVISF